MIFKVIKLFHDTPYSAQMAFDKTYLTIKSKFYLPKMRQHIKAYCRACHSCSINKKSNTKRKAPLGRYPEVTKIFGRVHMDLTGPIYSNTQTDFKYIATFQDYFTKICCMNSRSGC